MLSFWAEIFPGPLLFYTEMLFSVCSVLMSYLASTYPKNGQWKRALLFCFSLLSPLEYVCSSIFLMKRRFLVRCGERSWRAGTSRRPSKWWGHLAVPPKRKGFVSWISSCRREQPTEYNSYIHGFKSDPMLFRSCKLESSNSGTHLVLEITAS